LRSQPPLETIHAPISTKAGLLAPLVVETIFATITIPSVTNDAVVTIATLIETDLSLHAANASVPQLTETALLKEAAMLIQRLSLLKRALSV